MLVLEGLGDLSESPVNEQVAYLLVERRRLLEEIEPDNAGMETVVDRRSDVLSPVRMQRLVHEFSADLEEELYQAHETSRAVKEQLDKSHKIEITSLQKQLQQSHAKVSELEKLLEQNKDHECSHTGDNNKCESSYVRALLSERDHLRNTLREKEGKVTELTGRVRVLERGSRQLEIDNETLAFKLSEVLAECDTKEAMLRHTRLRKNSKSSVTSSPRDSLKVHHVDFTVRCRVRSPQLTRSCPGLNRPGSCNKTLNTSHRS